MVVVQELESDARRDPNTLFGESPQSLSVLLIQVLLIRKL